MALRAEHAPEVCHLQSKHKQKAQGIEGYCSKANHLIPEKLTILSHHDGAVCDGLQRLPDVHTVWAQQQQRLQHRQQLLG